MSSSLVAAYGSDSDSDDAPSPSTLDSVKKSDVSAPGFHMGLPAPKNAHRAPVKRQIKVEAAPTVAPEPPAPATKRPRMSASDTPSHSLFSMLPEPQRKEPLRRPVDSDAAKETVVDDDVRLVVHETDDAKEKKGNEDFRAMLGLKPKTQKPAPSKPPVIIEAPSSTEPVTAEEQAPQTPNYTLSLSAAPDVGERAPEPEPEPEPTSYPGWKQDASGGWYPVTPEAHAQYAAWANYAQQQAEASAMAQVPAKTPLTDFDVSAEMQRAGPLRPAQAPAPKPERENLVSERLRTDKFTNMRARTRGQLTSLLAMAHESRPMLEEKWSQGKSKMRENKKRYGF
ncbi:hypothetical protein MCAP1_001656 [Malassezia caprae]|uniref:Mitotic checkpoint regulator, MAD2B-interacting-domain-containing protein n=1 Tax=Malassezia caprae TaxID=1381934 RepID=A0AAF0E9Y8_9BASI|nr:hypothetical protein MCAP1_001656 [Malassezia caprae]